MAEQQKATAQRFCWLLIPVILMACSLFGGTTSRPTQTIAVTETPSPLPGGAGSPGAENPCEDLSGGLEMQILVGPSDAVGLEPVAVGELPFSVTAEGESYPVQGGGTLQYEDTLTADWGTYTATMNMLAEISGTCNPIDGQGSLNLTVSAQGEQLVVVEADGFQGEYPWDGARQLELAFPIEDGAQAEGEGWFFILHLE